MNIGNKFKVEKSPQRPSEKDSKLKESLRVPVHKSNSTKIII